MNFKLIFTMAVIALVAGCATHQKTPGTTFDLIGQEIQGAVGSKPKGADEALNQAMSVSYTHLDVYKRQPVEHRGGQARPRRRRSGGRAGLAALVRGEPQAHCRPGPDLPGPAPRGACGDVRRRGTITAGRLLSREADRIEQLAWRPRDEHLRAASPELSLIHIWM